MTAGVRADAMQAQARVKINAVEQDRTVLVAPFDGVVAVRQLFMVEAVLLSLTGAVVGIALGYLGAAILRDFYPKFPAYPPLWTALGGALFLLLGIALAQLLRLLLPTLPVHTPWSFAMSALAMLTIIGLLAGVLPARSASRLDLIEALRVE